ncbi:MAG: hypothetical protein HC845_05220 [Akkermansiaceae bacterium]|nr:hypothetical protein [Akkermansiaceae bacterium]
MKKLTPKLVSCNIFIALIQCAIAQTIQTVIPTSLNPIDTKIIGSYIPTANVALTTRDYGSYTSNDPIDSTTNADATVIPANVIERSREDWPLQVSYDVNYVKRTSAVLADLPSISVDLTKHRAFYNDQYIINLTGSEPYEFPRRITTPTLADNYPSSSLIFSPPDNQYGGIEKFSVYAVADSANSLTANVVSSKSVQVWPKISGSISFPPETPQPFIFNLTAPSLTINVKNVYPGSTVFVQLYQGPRQAAVDLRGVGLGSLGSFSNGGNWRIAPYSAVIDGRDWYSRVTSPGKWTIEMISLIRVKDGSNFTPNAAKAISSFGNSVDSTNQPGGGYIIANLAVDNVAGVEPGRYLIERSSSILEFEPKSTIEVNANIVTQD